MQWTPLPFPKCQSCTKSWASTQHLECANINREVYINSLCNTLKCQGCSKSWLLKNNIFKCTCGHQFSTLEVNNAIQSVETIKERLQQQINSLGDYEISIRQKETSSFKYWIGNFSYTISKALGKTVTEVLEIISLIMKF